MCSDRLTNLYLKRDAIEEALGTGKDYIEMQIRGRLVRMQASITVLEYLNQQIEKLERQGSASRGPARNIARVIR